MSLYLTLSTSVPLHRFYRIQAMAQAFPYPIFLVVESDWFPAKNRKHGVDEDRITILSAHTTVQAAQCAALTGFEKFARARGARLVYPENLNSAMRRWTGSVVERYTQMVKYMQEMKDNRYHNAYGTMYKVEKLYLPAAARALRPPFPVFVVTENHYSYGEGYEEDTDTTSLLSVFTSLQEAHAGAVAVYEGHMQEIENQDAAEVIEGWEEMSMLGRYNVMLEREDRKDVRSEKEFGTIFRVQKTTLVPQGEPETNADEEESEGEDESDGAVEDEEESANESDVQEVAKEVFLQSILTGSARKRARQD